MPDQAVKFSLVVTCFNEMKSLPQWHADVLAQTRRPDEIIIVDSESTDGTTEFLQDWAGRDPTVRVIVQKCSPARGHNIGNAAARGEFIVSTDMGVRLDPKWFEEIVKPADADPSVEVVAGSYAVDRSTIQTAAARAEYYINGDGTPRLGPGFVIGNRSVVYKKRVWQELGGLPEDLTRYADDSVFGRQILEAGYQMAFAPKALAYWARPRRFGQFWREQYNYGRGDGEAAIKTPIAFRLYKRGMLPRFCVPFVTALRTMMRQATPSRLWRALRKGDFVGLLCIAVFSFGSGWHFGRGYLVGDDWGAEHCRQCRARLRRRIPWLASEEQPGLATQDA